MEEMTGGKCLLPSLPGWHLPEMGAYVPWPLETGQQEHPHTRPGGALPGIISAPPKIQKSVWP